MRGKMKEFPACARGGFQVDIGWQDRQLTSATIRSDTGGHCSVSYGGKNIDFKINKNKSTPLNENLNLN